MRGQADALCVLAELVSKMAMDDETSRREPSRKNQVSDFATQSARVAPAKTEET